MDKLDKKDARKIMALYSTLVIMGLVELEEFLGTMMDVESCVGIHPEYISTWGPYLHMYDLYEDDDDT